MSKTYDDISTLIATENIVCGADLGKTECTIPTFYKHWAAKDYGAGCSSIDDKALFSIA